VYLTGVYLMGVYLINVHIMDVHLMSVLHGRAPHGRVSHFTSLPSAHDLGGENPYIDAKDVLKLLNCGRFGRQAADHPWSALRVVKLPKDCLTAEVLLEAKVAALHPERYQSSLSKLSTKREGEAGKEAQAIGLVSQSDGRKSGGQTGDRQTGDRQTG
jgi:hypothetical protein